MKKLTLILFFCLWGILSRAQNQATLISFKIPLHYGYISPQGYGSWQGFIWGFALASEFQIESSPFSLEYEFSVMKERYNLNEADFNQDSFISMINMKNCFVAKLYPFAFRLFFGLGIEFINQISGQFGDTAIEKDIDTEYLGTDTYAVFKTGYLYNISENFFLPLELKFIYDLTVKESAVLNLGGSLGAGYKFDL
ncbi:MAG: hypothetical protein JW827_09470 [Spirochaetes bacterium]|nr:hypothetical protein [Spirochaetota bacterium]